MNVSPDKPYLTLLELNGLIRLSISHALPDLYWVVAEIADLRCNQKHHCYLELVERDGETVKAQGRATVWAGTFGPLSEKFEKATGERLRRGMQVLLCAAVNFHEVYGLSLNVRDIDPTYSLGEMARKKREAIERLTRERIMDRNKMLPFPLVPQRVAIISSPTAAGWEDFLDHLIHNPQRYRFFTALFPALMQGEEAVSSIAGALRAIREKHTKYDVVAIVRGGGSQVDLSCFDSYELAAAVALFPLPVICGIGHERDESVLDMVAHRRMKTPTAVAEFLIGRVMSFDRKLADIEERLARCAERTVRDRTSELESLSKRLSLAARHTLATARHALRPHVYRLQHVARDALFMHRRKVDRAAVSLRYYPDRLLEKGRDGLGALQKDLVSRVLQSLAREAERLERTAQAVRLMDPRHVLKRGFSITYASGKALTDAGRVGKGQVISTQLYRGQIVSRVEECDEEGIKR
jgi:exodeoxyribonuclease VII large subunit